MGNKLDKLSELTLKLSQKLDLGTPEGLLDVLKNTAFKSEANDDQMTALLIVANQYSLNPWTKEIYAFPDKNNGIVPIVGVDGWSRIINSHPQFDGMDFDQDDEKCTCKIYRKDRNHPISITEWFSECKKEQIKTKNGFMIDTPWQSHPKRMLRHKAMIQCARIAFGFAGIYDQDEADRIIENNQPKESTIINGELNNPDRVTLISKGENAARLGVDEFQNFWIHQLTQEERKIIGTEEKDRLKAMCLVETKKEVNQDDNPF